MMQTWRTTSNDRTDDYFGNITGYVDMAGQDIQYQLNQNKQMIEETGRVDEAINARRGFVNANGERPPARHMVHIFDEAGHEVENVDIAAQLRTLKRYDDDDYSEAYYYIHRDGRVYQATYTEYDAMHRITKLSDTHLMVYLKYDENSNRRAAVAYALGDDPNQKEMVRQSWYDYTPANRVLKRDCKLENGNLICDSQQGMQITWKDGDVIAQDTSALHKDLKYEKGLLSNIAVSDGSKIHRYFDNGDRCYQADKKLQDGSLMTDWVDYGDDDSIKKQVHSERNNNATSTHEILQKTPSGKPKVESTETFNKINDDAWYQFHDTQTTEHVLSDRMKVAKVRSERNWVKYDGDIKLDALPPPAEVITTNDANGNITSVQGALAETFRSFVVNSENCIVLKQSAKGKNYYFYAEKRPGKTVLMAYFGDLPDQLKRKVKEMRTAKVGPYNPPVVNVDVNHQPLSEQYPPALPSEYITPREGMTYEQIAEELNYTGFAAAIAQANHADSNDTVPANQPVKIPPLYYEIPETAWNGSCFLSSKS